MKKNDFLIISTADWDSPIQTNKQYVSREIANLGNRVLYVESLGVRKIQIKKKDFFRIFKRIINNLLIIKQKEKNIWVLSPILFPGAKNKKIIFINRLIFNLNLFLVFRISLVSSLRSSLLSVSFWLIVYFLIVQIILSILFKIFETL